MSTSAPDTRPTRAVICSNCGNVTGEFSRETTSAVGECCRNLPEMWPIGGPGREGEAVDHSDEDDERPHCADCGSMSFLVHEHQINTYLVHTEEYDHDDSTLSISCSGGDAETDLVVINCDNCGSQWHGDYIWD